MQIFHGHPILASLFVATLLLVAITVTSPIHRLGPGELLFLLGFLALTFGVVAVSVSLGIGLAR